MPQYALPILSRPPPAPERGGGSARREGNKRGIRQKPPRQIPKFRKRVLCHNGVARLPKPAPTLSGGGRQDKVRKPRRQPSPREKNRDTPSRRTPTRKLGKRQKVEDNPSKSRKAATKKYREPRISYPRLRLEVHLRYVGPPVQTR